MELIPKTLKQYHVFIASPGDTNEERKMVRQYFERYNGHTAQLWGVRFEVIDWENYATVGIGRPQELITKQTLDRFKDSMALVVGLMAQRFGSPTGKAESGTEEEFRWALDNYQKTGFPEIKWFFKRVDQFISPADPAAVEEALDQWKKVRAFREELQKIPIFYGEYPATDRFPETLTQHAPLSPVFSPPRNYHHSIERDFRRLDIAGIDNDRAFEIPLSEIYVRLRVMFDDDSQMDSSEIRDTGPIDVQTALLRYRKLVIVGDPGSGKSTFLKYVALMLARSVLANNPGIALEKLCLQEPLPIPIFVSCWDLSDFLRKHGVLQLTALLDFLVERLGAHGFQLPVAELQTLLEAGNCCLLFDGLDEVPTDGGRAAVSRLLEDCVKEFPENRYLVTSRVRAYTGDTILKGEFTRCDIQPFDSHDREQFLNNWIGLLFKISPEAVSKPGTEANREFQSLTKGIESNDRIRPLAVNPLLLTVIAIVHWNRKRLPEQRVDLYDECVDVLLGQRKEAERVQLGRKHGAFDEQYELEQLEERAWVRKRFAEIALHILRQATNRDEAGRSEIINLLVPRFIDQGASSQERAETRATLFLERQELRSGLLVSRQEQSYRFVHLTFQEYLAAWHLANQEFDQVVPILEPQIRQQRWFETLQLLGGEWAKQSDEKLDRYLAWLLERQGKSITERAPVIALCANIVKDTTGIAELKPETRKKFKAGVEGTLDAFRPGSGIPALTQLEILEALGRLGAAVKHHLITATKSGLFQVRRQAIEMLLPHLSDDELFAMDHILNDRSKEPIKTYIVALTGRDPFRTARFLQTRTELSEKATEAFAATLYLLEPVLGRSALTESARTVFSVGHSFRRYPEYWYYSTDRFEHRWDYYPQASSRAVLLDYLGDENLVRAAVTSDREAVVRLSAALNLLTRDKLESEDWKLITRVVTHEDDHYVRNGLLTGVANKQKDAMESWTIIRDAAINDESPDVRISALELLWKEKKNDPDTRIFLEKVAINDSNSSVRATALGFLASQNEAVDSIKNGVNGLLSSIGEVNVRSLQFVKIAANIVQTPVQRRLLTDELNGRSPFLDPCKPVLTKQAKKAASILRISEVEGRKAYEELADLIAAKLGVELKLEWRNV